MPSTTRLGSRTIWRRSRNGSRPAAGPGASRIHEKSRSIFVLPLTTAFLLSTTLAGWAQDAVPLDRATLQGDEVIGTPADVIELQDSYFEEDASQHLFDSMDLQRAAQHYIWSTPLVSQTTWRDNQGEAFGTNKPGAFAVLETLKESVASSPPT